jgi:16S rRNA (adenine1518-N6/adenine1519-N6)-dimethyltransferase
MHRPRKRFGQNFLHDPRIISQVVSVIAPRPGEHLIEIGPGQGAITVPLLACGTDLEVIELDRDLIMELEALTVPANASLRVHNADALAADLCAMAGDNRKLRVVGNLPYNISTPLLFRLLEQQHCIQDMHLMLQKEVVERMAAGAGGRDYGRLSIMVQYHCRVQPLFTIGPGAFSPQPKVESSFVRLTPHLQGQTEVKDYDAFALVVKTAFGYRRKTLRNALKGLAMPTAFTAADIDPDRRPEQLTLEEFARLSNRIMMERNSDSTQ